MPSLTIYISEEAYVKLATRALETEKRITSIVQQMVYDGLKKKEKP
jgi:hypothetical protein